MAKGSKNSVGDMFDKYERDAKKRARSGNVFSDKDSKSTFSPGNKSSVPTKGSAGVVRPGQGKTGAKKGKDKLDTSINPVSNSPSLQGASDLRPKKKPGASGGSKPDLKAGSVADTLKGKRKGKGDNLKGKGQKTANNLGMPRLNNHSVTDTFKNFSGVDLFKTRDAHKEGELDRRRRNTQEALRARRGAEDLRNDDHSRRASKVARAIGFSKSRDDEEESGGQNSQFGSLGMFRAKVSGKLGAVRNVASAPKKAAKVKRNLIIAGAVMAFIAFLFLVSVIAGFASILGSQQQQQNASTMLSITGEGAEVVNDMPTQTEEPSGEDSGDGGGDSGNSATEEPSVGADSGDSVSSDDSGNGRLYGSDGGGASNVSGISKRQLENAKHVLAATKAEGLSQKATEDVFTAVWVESQFWNLANDGSGLQGALKEDQDPNELKKSMQHPESDGLPSDHGFGHGGDHGSLGLLQQQYPWWGTVDELMTQETSTKKFIEKYKQAKVEDMDTATAVQTVQRSAFGDGSNYREGKKTAVKILEEVQKS